MLRNFMQGHIDEILHVDTCFESHCSWTPQEVEAESSSAVFLHI